MKKSSMSYEMLMRMDNEFRQQEMEYNKMAAITPMRTQITNEMRMNASEQMRLEERMYDAYSVISARHQNNKKNEAHLRTSSFYVLFLVSSVVKLILKTCVYILFSCFAI